MKNSTFFGLLTAVVLTIATAFQAQSQTVTIYNTTDCDVSIELGFQNQLDPPCTLNTTVVTVPCGMTITVPPLPGTDVFKGYVINGDLATGVNVVYHCGVFTPNGCSGVGINNPVGCGSCNLATQTCWRNTSGGIVTGNYDIGIF